MDVALDRYGPLVYVALENYFVKSDLFCVVDICYYL